MDKTVMNNTKQPTEAEIKAMAAKTDVPSYLMSYHKIRWALVDYDLEKMRF